MDVNDPNTILAELKLQESGETEDGQVYYTILQRDLDNYTLRVDDQELLDPSSVLYLKFENGETEEVESTETETETEIQQDELVNIENALNFQDPKMNLELLEQVTLPDGTQAYMTRDVPQDDDILEQSADTFELNDSTMLLQNLKCEIQLNDENDDDAPALPDENLAENIILSGDNDEFYETKYEQVQLEDGTEAFIEIRLYHSIIEQNKKKGQSSKDNSSKVYVCRNNDCNKSYSTMHDMRVHMRSHTGFRPYKCKVDGCEKAFATGYSLKAHSRTHTGEKPYACQTCDKSFKTSGDLQKHTRIHTGEKPFLCPVEGCGRSFTTSNIRKVHIRSHTGERPYQCPEPGCQKAFASATNYKNHIRIHSGEKPYVCSVEGCEKRFTEYSSLYKHQIVHTNSKHLKCEYCGRVCRQPSTLIAHKKAVHNIIITENGTEIMIKMVDNAELNEYTIGDKVDDFGTQILFVSE